MSVRIERRGDRLVADIRVKTPQGRLRERAAVPMEITSPSGARRWAEARAFHLGTKGKEPPKIVCPTLREFGPRWIKEYAIANGNKPSMIDTKETILRLHLYPLLGGLRLDQIADRDLQRLKFHLQVYSNKTSACVLSVMSTLLRTAERWDIIPKAPRIEGPRWAEPEMSFYDFEEWERL